MELSLGLSDPPGIPPSFFVGENPVPHVVPMPLSLAKRFRFLRCIELLRNIRTGHEKPIRLNSCCNHRNRGSDEKRLKAVSSPAFCDRFSSVDTRDGLDLRTTVHMGPARFRPPIEAMFEGPTIRLCSANYNCPKIIETAMSVREAQQLHQEGRAGSDTRRL